jgi:bifunctional non-homologous end joining protein LigD
VAVKPHSTVFPSNEKDESAPDLLRKACEFGLEGLVSKRRNRPYQAGRSKHWIKIKNRHHAAMSRVMEASR